MKKYLLKQTKKSLSLFLAVLMLLSCWVWVAPEKAAAANAENGEYQLRMIVNSSDAGAVVGMEAKVYYKDANGNRQSVAMVCDTAKMQQTGTDMEVATVDTISGFPTDFEFGYQIDSSCGNLGNGTYMDFRLQVYNNATGGWETLNNYSGLGYSDKGDGTYGSDAPIAMRETLQEKYPVVSSIGSLGDKSLAIPAIDSGLTNKISGLQTPLYDQYGVRLSHVFDANGVKHNVVPTSYFVADNTGATIYNEEDWGIWVDTSSDGKATVYVNEDAQKELRASKGQAYPTNDIYLYAAYGGISGQTSKITLSYEKYETKIDPKGTLENTTGLSMELMSTSGLKSYSANTWTANEVYGATLNNWPTGVATKDGYNFYGFWTKQQPTTGNASRLADNFSVPVSTEDFVNKYGGNASSDYVTKDGIQYFNAGKQWDASKGREIFGADDYFAWWQSKVITVKFYDIDGKYLGSKTTKCDKVEDASWYLDPKDNYESGAYTYATFANKWQDITGEEIVEGSHKFGANETLSLTPVYVNKTYNDKYTVTFINPASGGAITGSSTEYNYRDLLSDENIPTVSAPVLLANDKGYTYEFAGWSSQKPESGNCHKIAVDDDIFTVNTDWVVRNDVTYYAVFRGTPKEYVIAFNYTDSTGVAKTETQTILYGSAISTPDYVNRTYAKDGYGFNLEGWNYYDGNRASATFGADDVLVFNEQNVNITNANLVGGTAPVYFTADYDDGAPTPYNITFKYKSKDGSDAVIVDGVRHGDKITQAIVDRLVVPDKYDDGEALYTFANKWKVTEGNSDKTEYTASEFTSFSPTSHVTFEAIYDDGVPYHTVKYVANNLVYTEKILAGFNVPAWMVQTGTDENGDPVMEEYVPMDYASENGTYRFVGWFDEEQTDEARMETNGTEYTTDSIVSGDLVLYAQYKFEPYKYTIKFMNHDGTVPLGSIELEKGQSFSTVFYEAQRAAQLREADETYTYTFIGWDQPYDEENLVCEGKDVTYTALYRPSYIYYKANWYNSLADMEAKTPIYDETDDTKQIGTVGLLATTNYTYEGSVYAPSVDLEVPEGKVFAGWYYLKDGEATAYQRGMTITADMDFYATYDDAEVVYEVTAVVNGVSTAYEVAENTVANIVPRPLDGFKDAEKHNKFEGWYTDADYVNAFDIEKTAITQDITIYAKFTEADHVKDQKEVVTAPTYYEEGKEVKWCACNKEGTEEDVTIPMLTDTVAPTGTIYLGTQGKWSSTDAEGAAATDDQDVTLYANADTDIILTINDTAGNCADENCDGASCVNCVYNPSGVGKGVAIIQGIISTGVFGAETTEITGIQTIFSDNSETLNNTANYVIRLGTYAGLEDGKTYIAYYYARDKADNVLNKNVRTAKFIYDTTAPTFAITGDSNAATVASTATYCGKATVTGIEVGATVTVNGREVALTTTSASGIGTYNITAPGNYVITVTDKAGNSTSKKIIVAEGHNEITSEKAVTCTEDGYKNVTCAICSKKISEETIASTGHQYGEKTIVAATCEKGGYDVEVCTVCDHEKKTNEKPATGHTYKKENNSIVYKEITPATCRTEGKMIANCTVCGKGTLTEDIAPVEDAHVYGPVKVLKPTCTEEGMYYQSCKYCFAPKQGEKIDATGHEETYSKIEKYPTCKDTGLEKEYCKKCHTYIEGKDRVIPATDKHTWVASTDSEKTFPATGDKDGQITYICSGCQSEKIEKIEKIEKFSVSFYNEDGETLLFTISDVVKGTTITENYTWTETTGEGEDAEITDKAIVEPTKASDKENDYKFAGWVDAEGKDVKFPFELTANMTLKATFKASARLYTHIFMVPGAAVATAGEEDNYIEFANIVGKYGDSNKQPSRVPTLKATETETYEFIGWKNIDGKIVADFTMTDNATFYADFKVVPVTYDVNFYNGEDYVDSVTVNAGSKVEPIKQELTKASDETYHYTFNGWYADAELTKAFDFANTSIMGLTRIYAGFAATEHIFTTIYTNAKGEVVTFAPTCVDDGQTTMKCACGYEKVTTVPATGNHVYGEPDENGVKHCTTEGCDAKLEPEASKVTIKFMDGTTVLESIELKEGETYTYTAPAKESTTQYDYKFSMWSWTDADGKTATSDKAEITVTAGAEDAVYNVIYTETVRKYRVSYVYGTEVYFSEYVVYNADLPTIDTIPTKKETLDVHYNFTGWTVDGEALGENIKVDRDYVIEAGFVSEAHSLQEEYIGATCTGTGGMKKVCKCGYTVDANDVVPALGHDWSTPVIVEPTYDAPGSITKKCKRAGCDEIYEEVLPQLTYKSLKVTVTKNGASVDSATVSLYIGDQWIVTGKTKNGTVTFNELEEATYTVLAVKDSDNKTVNDVVVNGVKEITIELAEESSDSNNNNNAPSCSCSCHRSGFWGILFRFFHKVISWLTGRVNCCADPQL